MKISRIEVFPLTSERPTLRVGHPIDAGWWGYDQTLVRVETDEGLGGWGTAGTRWELADAARKVLTPLLIGQDALQPEAVTERLHQWTFWYGRGGTITNYIGAINIALWDILGQHTGLSISRLFGGRYVEAVTPYASMLFTWPAKTMVENLTTGLEKRFRAFKLGWGPFGRVDRGRDEELVKTARRTVGDGALLMVDAGGSDVYWHNDLKWAAETARMLKDYDVAWFEEPLRPDDLEGHCVLRAQSPVPIATGEVLTRRQAFEPWIREGAADILQPDVTICGGLSEARRIWQAAYDRGIRVVMHGWNTAVGAASDLQLTASMPNGSFLEYWHPAPYVSGILKEPLLLNEAGLLPIPDRPGLGIEIDLEAVRACGRGAEDFGG
jgi:L-alanine-DL-glutamate epimerase-like enolase superfamily enzyme